jgi:single-stranded-DNA-specific exonuclease
MGAKYKVWHGRYKAEIQSLQTLQNALYDIRQFSPIDKLLYNEPILNLIADDLQQAIEQNKKIALYADYDVDGTMSCVSWIWFLKSIGYKNFVHYIPCRFEEGYGVNLNAIKHLIHNEHADVIVTMDTGITANDEAAYCKSNNVLFICTDHHKIQPARMPDCRILNPKMHPDPLYQELCGAGITFVLLRTLGKHFGIGGNHPIWTDLLALTGMATICDVVPLNGVNHRLAKMGVDALMRSDRPILRKLLAACKVQEGDEKDVGFRIGPRINAVGRLSHANTVIQAFVQDDNATQLDALIKEMAVANERRRFIQNQIVEEARTLARTQPSHQRVLFLGGNWHPGVVGIAAAKIAEEFWKPTWLFQRESDNCKGSARSIPGFDVTSAMNHCHSLFKKFGGHQAAGGFSFETSREDEIRAGLEDFASAEWSKTPHLWESSLHFDCELPGSLISMDSLALLDQLKPYGHGFEEPKFLVTGRIKNLRHFLDKETQAPKHTSLTLEANQAPFTQQVNAIFFNTVIPLPQPSTPIKIVATLNRNTYKGRESLQLQGLDYEL